MPEKIGSSGRTRTYNPPVNSPVRCRNFKNLAAQMTIHGNIKNHAVKRSAILCDPYLTHVFVRYSSVPNERTDFDFKRSVVLIQRSAVGKRLNRLKTEY